MSGMKFPTWPSYSLEEIDVVQKVLLSNRVNYWTGQEGRFFEQEFAAWVETKHAIALSNGSVALELALRAIGIMPGDEVIVTPRTYIASVSSIVLAGAKPVFADVDADSQNITARSIERVLTRKTRAIICVHLAGWPCEMGAIMDLAIAKDLYVIEDCAQAHGARYNGYSVGALGHLAAWSFCQDKIMTTGGEGGMLTTDDEEFWKSSWAFKDHGKNYDTVNNLQRGSHFNWVHDSFGTNWRMTELQAALGRLQLRYMDKWHVYRLKNAKQIWDCARDLSGLYVPTIPQNIEHAAYKCYVFVDMSALKKNWNRDRILSEINAKGVPCFTGVCPEVYLEKAFDNTDYRPKVRLPVAKNLGDSSLMFLVHPTLGSQEIDQTCAVLKAVIKKAIN